MHGSHLSLLMRVENSGRSTQQLVKSEVRERRWVMVRSVTAAGHIVTTDLRHWSMLRQCFTVTNPILYTLTIIYSLYQYIIYVSSNQYSKYIVKISLGVELWSENRSSLTRCV